VISGIRRGHCRRTCILPGILEVNEVRFLAGSHQVGQLSPLMSPIATSSIAPTSEPVLP